MLKKKIIVLVMIAALLISTVQPASAASISGDVAPSGTDYLMNYLANAEKLPDRIRYTFEIPQPEENYYSLTLSSGGTSRTSYDLTSVYALAGGWTTGTSFTHYLYIYPAGRVFYRLPCPGSIISSSDLRFEVTVQCRKRTSTSAGSDSYSSGVSNNPTFEFRFYDGNRQLVSSVNYSSYMFDSTGVASSDSFTSCSYYSAVVIPSEAVYVIPVVYIKRPIPKSSSMPSTVIYDQVSPIGMSCSIRFDVMNAESQVDGIWQFNDTISYVSDFFESVNFLSGGVEYSGMDYYPSDMGGISLHYSLGADAEPEPVYGGNWYIDSKRTVDFGASGQEVSAEFYDFLTKNATRIGDSSADLVEGSISIKDYSGSNVFADHSFTFPVTVNVSETGLNFISYTDANVAWEYNYTGTGSFVGASLVANASSTRYKPGSSFVMTSPGSIYLHVEGNTDSGGSGTTDPTDPPSPTDPTDPGGSSGPTEPTKDPLEDEKDQAGVGGNSAADDLAGAIPDYSEGFIAALQNFVGAFSYEGTACLLTIPAITMPAVGGVIPEFEIYPESVVNVENLFTLLPHDLLLLAQSLLTGGLIIYCFKELYDTISYFLTLRKGEG